MKFNEVLPALKAGKKVRRGIWKDCGYIKNKNMFVVGEIVTEDDVGYALTMNDLEATDWEIVEESKKVKFRDLTKEQYGKWIKNNCTRKYGENCEGCPFRITKCSTWNSSCWINHKESFSDKFLDQEIEIEVEEDEI